MVVPSLRIDKLTNAVLTSGASADAHFKLAALCLEHDRLVSARDLALRLLNLDPHHPGAGALLRRVYSRDPERASDGAQVTCACCGAQLPYFVRASFEWRMLWTATRLKRSAWTAGKSYTCVGSRIALSSLSVQR